MTETAAREEIAAFAQFAFFRPHLGALLEACAQASLPLLVLKGAALAETVYARPSLRLFGDLDVLVRAEDAPRAKAILEALGYGVDPHVWEDLVCRRDCQANFFLHTPRGPVVVELHTGLINNCLFADPFSCHWESLWERALPVRLAGVEAFVLGPEDQLLHLCLHLACHYFAAPQSVRDIIQVCAVREIRWPFFVTLARQAELSSCCFAALFAASQMQAGCVPASVLDELAPRAGRVRLERLAAARAADSTHSQTEHLRLPLLWHLLETPSRRGKAFGHILFPSRHWLQAHYGDDVLEADCSLTALRGAHARFLLKSLRPFTPR